jgi:hypothetical protein
VIGCKHLQGSKLRCTDLRTRALQACAVPLCAVDKAQRRNYDCDSIKLHLQASCDGASTAACTKLCAGCRTRRPFRHMLVKARFNLGSAHGQPRVSTSARTLASICAGSRMHGECLNLYTIDCRDRAGVTSSYCDLTGSTTMLAYLQHCTVYSSIVLRSSMHSRER